MAAGQTVGYPDGSRTSQQVQLLPIWTALNATNVAIQSAVAYAGTYPQVLVAGSIANNQAILSINSFAEQAAVNLIGAVKIALDPGVTRLGEFVAAVYGPWVQVELDPNPGGANFTPTIRAFLVTGPAAKRATSSTSIPYQKSVTLQASQTVTLLADAYTSGRSIVRTTGGSQGCNPELDYLDPISGAWVVLDSWTVAANAIDRRDIIFPPHATRVKLTNPTAILATTPSTFTVVQDT